MLALAAVGALALLGLTAERSTAYEICEKEVVYDYAKPLEEMPPLRGRPVNGLPFGPKGIALTSRNRSQLLLPGSEELGYTVSHSHFLGAKGPIHVNWLVTAKLARVDRRGEVQEALVWKSRHVSHLGRKSPARFPLFLPGEPGFYRFEIVFRDGSGKRLGRFGEYVRVLPPSLDARLALNGTTFRPGDTVTARVENYGTESLDFGLPKSIEAFNGSGWARTEIGSDPVILILLGVGPGEAAQCWSVRLPPETPPGLYRFAVNVDPVWGNSLRSIGADPVTLTAEFTVG